MTALAHREPKGNYAYLSVELKWQLASEGSDSPEFQCNAELFYSTVTEILRSYGANHVGKILSAPSPLLEVGFECPSKLKRFQECLISGHVIENIKSTGLSTEFDVSLELVQDTTVRCPHAGAESSLSSDCRQGNVDVQLVLEHCQEKQRHYMPNNMELSQELKEVNRWFDLGTFLNVPDSELRKIQSESQWSINQCKADLISYLCKHECTWLQVVEALQVIGEMKTARRIVDKYKLDIILSAKGKRRRPQEASPEPDDGNSSVHSPMQKRPKKCEHAAYIPKDVCTCQCAKEWIESMQKQMKDQKTEISELKDKLDSELRRQLAQANEEIKSLKNENQQLKSTIQQQLKSTPPADLPVSEPFRHVIHHGESNIISTIPTSLYESNL